MKALALSLLCAAVLPSCYFSMAAPKQPYGQPVLDHRKVAPFVAAPGAPAPIAAKQPVIVRRFQSRVVNPVGALHDEVVTNETPIWELYFTTDPALPFFEAFAAGLKERGVQVLKDYDALPLGGAAANLGPPAPLLLDATLLSLRHDKVRAAPLEMYEVIAAALRVELRDARGRSLVRVEHALTVRLREGSEDALATVAQALLMKTLETPTIRAALEGGTR